MTKGRLLGPDGIASPQIDVLVLSPSYPEALVDKKLYLAGGVAAAFECKITLRSGHIREFFENCCRIRPLVPVSKGTPFRELRSPIIYGRLAHSHEWKAESSTPSENIARIIEENECELVTAPMEMPDFICVADLGNWDAAKFIMPVMAGVGRIAFGTPDTMGWTLMSTYSASLLGADRQLSHFTPIGAMLGSLYQKMAWFDPSMRSLARYFRIAGMLGTGSGQTRQWPPGTLSSELMDKALNQQFSNGAEFDEWSIGPY